jgi:hypothetical protein
MTVDGNILGVPLSISAQLVFAGARVGKRVVLSNLGVYVGDPCAVLSPI